MTLWSNESSNDISNAACEAVANNIPGTLAIPHPYGRLQFGADLDLTGIVLTKLDGTAKGGVVLAIAAEHKLPVRYIGVGERPQDLRDFDADEFVEAMLGSGDDAAQAA